MSARVVGRRRRGTLTWLLASLLVVAAAIGCAGPAAARLHRPAPPIRHVFVIVLENEDAASTFGPGTKAPYLARTLTARGQFLPNYYGVAHLSLGNYIALVSGQGTSRDTQVDCPVYRDLTPGTIGADGQALGQGCVYPRSVRTIADQLAARHLSWKGYMEDMGNSATEPARCRHPALGAFDRTIGARVGDQYATRHNPFVYFHSLTDSSACVRNDVPLDHLKGDLRAPRRTPNYAFITPNLCHDGHDEPCVDGEPGGLVSADAFLRRWVPLITRSAAYRRGGLLVITFDEAEAGGATADSSACCSEPQFPNVARNGITGPGGGRVGAVVLSPAVRPGSVNTTPYNHFSLLRSVENIFHLRHLGYAGRPGLKAFGSDVFGCRGRASHGRGSGSRRARRACRSARA